MMIIRNLLVLLPASVVGKFCDFKYVVEADEVERIISGVSARRAPPNVVCRAALVLVPSARFQTRKSRLGSLARLVD